MDLYLWIKAAHVMSVIAWMAGIFYLPRLFVYHAATPVGSQQSETFKVMERRLLRGIMTPALIATFVFGTWTALDAGWFSGDGLWLDVKFVLVLVLAAFHGACAKWRKDFEADRNKNTERFYRIANEVPTLLVFAIVILVVVKPF
jgi:putative membrane protein